MDNFTIQQVLAIVVPLAGALGYVGKVLIVAFTRNIDRQQDLAEKHLTLLADGIMKQGTALTELILQNKAHQATSVAYHEAQCKALDKIILHLDMEQR